MIARIIGAIATITTDLVEATTTVLARIDQTFVNIEFAILTLEALWTDANVATVIVVTDSVV